MLSDTRTNAGLDNISVFRKMFVWERPGDRVMTLMTAGNLSNSQSVVNLLDEGIRNPETGKKETITSVPSMFRAAQLVGRAVREIYTVDGKAMEAQDTSFSVSMLLGGQIKDRSLRLFQIYSAGNFIEATADTPYLQIGEHKYGKPILDRTMTFDTTLENAVKAALISMDSTLRSNLSVGMPLDLLVYRRDSLRVTVHQRLQEADPYFSAIRNHWSTALKEIYGNIPTPDWIE